LKKLLFIILLPSLLLAQGRFVRHARRGDTTGVTILKADSFIRLSAIASAQIDSVGGNIYQDGEDLFFYDGTNNIYVDLTRAGGIAGMGVFDVTAYGIVGELYEVVPKLIEKIKEKREV